MGARVEVGRSASAVAGVWVISYTDLGYGGDQEKMSDSDYFVGSVGRI